MANIDTCLTCPVWKPQQQNRATATSNQQPLFLCQHGSRHWQTIQIECLLAISCMELLRVSILKQTDRCLSYPVRATCSQSTETPVCGITDWERDNRRPNSGPSATLFDQAHSNQPLCPDTKVSLTRQVEANCCFILPSWPQCQVDQEGPVQERSGRYCTQRIRSGGGISITSIKRLLGWDVRKRYQKLL